MSTHDLTPWELELSPACFREIRRKLRESGYGEGDEDRVVATLAIREGAADPRHAEFRTLPGDPGSSNVNAAGSSNVNAEGDPL